MRFESGKAEVQCNWHVTKMESKDPASCGSWRSPCKGYCAGLLRDHFHVLGQEGGDEEMGVGWFWAAASLLLWSHAFFIFRVCVIFSSMCCGMRRFFCQDRKFVCVYLCICDLTQGFCCFLLFVALKGLRRCLQEQRRGRVLQATATHSNAPAQVPLACAASCGFYPDDQFLCSLHICRIVF